jgi:hypothetical protein
VAVAGATVLPYLIWQRSRLGGWVPVKSNGPFELYLGNTRDAQGFLSNNIFKLHHPSQSTEEFRRYRELGELPYVREKFAEFRQSFSLPRFAAATGRRFYEYFFAYELKSWEASPRSILAKRFMWALPGAILVLFPLVRRQHLGKRVLVAYALAFTFALPFILAGVMERYRLPMSVVAAVLGAGLLLGGKPEGVQGRAANPENRSADG